MSSSEEEEPSKVIATVYLITGDIERPDSIAHSRSWNIPLNAVDPFAEMMTEAHGEPRHAMKSVWDLVLGASGSEVFLDLDEGSGA